MKGNFVPTLPTEITDAFRRAMEQAGLTAPDIILSDGALHRFATNGRPDDKAGWYVFHPDGIPAGAFGDWRVDLKGTWCAKSELAMTPAERTAHHERAQAMQRQRETEEQELREQAAHRAEMILRQTKSAPSDHPYILRKKIPHLGLVVDDQNRIFVAMTNALGKVVGGQVIEADGSKRFMYGTPLAGSFHLIKGETADFTKIHVGEGLATVLSASEAINTTGVVAFCKNNLLAVAKLFRTKYPHAEIIIIGDNDRDGGGQQKAIEAAKSVKAAVAISDMPGWDWNDVHVQHGLGAVKAGIENAIRAYRTGPLNESNFAPIRACDLLAETPEPVEYILDEYLPTGSLVLLAGKPKEGKSTLVYEAAVAIAKGQQFLERATRQSGVLILAVEEHRRDIRMRLHDLGAEGLLNLHLSIGPASPSHTFFSEIHRFVKSNDIKLIIIDTLAAFWRVEHENDASEMTKAIKPLLQLARESGACVLLIHHARKSEGSHGDEIRGSGALFGLVDVALVMKRHEVENQRLLQAQSRYSETPAQLILQLSDSGYIALGDPASTNKRAKMERLLAHLSEHWEEAEPVIKRTSLKKGAGKILLGLLVDQGKALRDGKGVKGAPFRFKRNAIHSSPPVYKDESNGMESNGGTESIQSSSIPPKQIEYGETDQPEEVITDAD